MRPQTLTRLAIIETFEFSSKNINGEEQIYKACKGEEVDVVCSFKYNISCN